MLRFWHFEIEGDNERLNEVAYLMNNLNEKIKKIHCPEQSLSLDESMALWRGRLIFKQYIKKKKHKYGVKFYEVCDSSGLILRSMIYSGIPYPDSHSLGQTGAIVLKFKMHFTKHESSNGTYICGTLRADRKNNPKEVVRKKLGKGEMVWARNKTAVVCKWKDKRDVLTISNKRKAELIRVTNRRGKKMKPNIVTKQFVGIKKLAFIS